MFCRVQCHVTGEKFCCWCVINSLACLQVSQVSYASCFKRGASFISLRKDRCASGRSELLPYHFNLLSESCDKSGSLATKTIVKVGFTVTSILRHSLNDIENRSVPHFIRLPKSGFTGVCLFVFLFIYFLRCE